MAEIVLCLMHGAELVPTVETAAIALILQEIVHDFAKVHTFHDVLLYSFDVSIMRILLI